MNSLLQLLEERHSVRRFASQPVEPDKIDQLVRAVMTAPTSKNKHSWRFAFVTDRALCEKLASAKDRNADFLRYAPLNVVVMSDTADTLCWIEDASIAATILQLEAEDLGLKSCWAQLRDRSRADGVPSEEYIRHLLNQPESVRTLCVLGIGYPASDAHQAHVRDLNAADKVTFY